MTESPIQGVSAPKTPASILKSAAMALEDEGYLELANDIRSIPVPAQGAPDLGDLVSIKRGTPYFYDWRGVEMKIVSLCIDPDGKRWASVIDQNDPKNTRHRGFGVYDGETTDFELDHLERTSAPPSTESGGR